jgi:hypothetical protein
MRSDHASNPGRFIQLYDYGTPVTVTAPPTQQTDDLTNQIVTGSATTASSPTA